MRCVCLAGLDVTMRAHGGGQRAFHLAFLNDKPDIALCLLNHLDCTSAYNVSFAAGGEGGLFSSVLLSVKQLKRRASKAVTLWGRLACAALKHAYGFDGLVWERWTDLFEKAQMDEEARYVSGSRGGHVAVLIWRRVGRRLLEACRVPTSNLSENGGSALATFQSRARRVSVSSFAARRGSTSLGSINSAAQQGVQQRAKGVAAPGLKKSLAELSGGPTRALEQVAMPVCSCFRRV
eukprot:188275-Rhodomonas_salina.4